MRILVTGIRGFIGSHLGERFRAEGHEVDGVDNNETGRVENWPVAWDFDISDRKRLYAFANHFRPDLVIHCAASYSDPDKWHRDVRTNVEGTINVCNVARHHGAKIVYFQTSLPPVSSYAVSKIAAEHYIRLSGADSLVFRLANIYGPRNVSGPIPAFFKLLSEGKRCTVAQTGRDMVYISDLVDCVCKAVYKNRAGTFDVCSGNSVPIASLYRQVAAHFENPPEPEFIAPPLGDVATVLSFDVRLPGWYPLVNLVDGIHSAVEWYREHGVEKSYTHLRMEEKDEVRAGKAA